MGRRAWVAGVAVAIGMTVPGGVAGAQTTTARTVPTSLSHGQVLTRVNINGYKAFMQVDTGATTSVIDSRIAKEINLAPAGKPVTTQTIGCSARSQPVAVRSWAVGQVPLPDLTISALRTTGEIPTHKKLPVIGLLGNDALSSFGTVGVDFVDKRLVLGGAFPHTGRELDAGALVDKRTGAVALFTAKVRIGGKAALFGLDTGAGLSLVEKFAAKKLGLTPLTNKKVKVGAVACETKATPVLIRNWMSGGIRLGSAIAISRPAGLRELGLAGLVGAPTLARYGRANFDYVNQRVNLGFPVPHGAAPSAAPPVEEQNSARRIPRRARIG